MYKKYPFTQNRELSWLRFNERVLEEAADPRVPLLERLKFIAIFTSNLDEFYMIRCGSLYDLSLIDKDNIDEYINDIEILLSLIRKWCKEKIVLIGLNNAYANSLLKQEAKKYDLIYIDIYSYASFYKIDDKLNILGHKYISEEIIDKL